MSLLKSTYDFKNCSDCNDCDDCNYFNDFNGILATFLNSCMLDVEEGDIMLISQQLHFHV